MTAMTPASVTGAGQEQPRTLPGGDWASRANEASLAAFYEMTNDQQGDAK